MWNDNEHQVSEVERGDDVTIRSFGGEGQGMKSMKPLQWKNGQNIRFKVRSCLSFMLFYTCDIYIGSNALVILYTHRKIGSI